MKPAERIARAVLGVFRQQRRLAEGGKEGFSDWHARLAEALEEPIADLYLAGGRRAKADETVADDLASAARERVIQTARGIDETSRDWLREGREPEVVFSADRAAQIALTEENHAVSQGLALAARSRGKRLRWKAGRKACKLCAKLNGRTIKPGQQFVVEGIAVYHTPLHPN